MKNQTNCKWNFVLDILNALVQKLVFILHSETRVDPLMCISFMILKRMSSNSRFKCKSRMKILKIDLHRNAQFKLQTFNGRIEDALNRSDKTAVMTIKTRIFDIQCSKSFGLFCCSRAILDLHANVIQLAGSWRKIIDLIRIGAVNMSQSQHVWRIIRFSTRIKQTKFHSKWNHLFLVIFPLIWSWIKSNGTHDNVMRLRWSQSGFSSCTSCEFYAHIFFSSKCWIQLDIDIKTDSITMTIHKFFF